MAVELHQIHSGDVQAGMLYLDLLVDLLHHLHAQLGEIGNGLFVDLVHKAQLVGIHKGKEGAAEGNVKGYLLAVYDYLLVGLIQEGGDVLECYAQNLAILDLCLGADYSCGGFQNYLGVGLLGLYHAGLDGYGDGAYGAVAAHVEPSAGIHEEYGKVGLRIDGLADVRAEHVVVAAGLKHQSSAIVVIVLFQPVLALDGGVALGLGEAGVHYTAEFACGMGVDGLEARFEPVKVYLGVVIHDLLSYLLYFNGAKGGAKMKTRVTVKNFAVAEKCFHHAVKEGLMKNLSIPSDYYHSNRCKSQ